MPNSGISPEKMQELISQELNEIDELLHSTRNLLEELLSSEAVTLSVFQIRTVLLNERLNKFLNERIPF